MANNKIPEKIKLDVKDPFVRYLAYMFNTGVDYQLQSKEIIRSVDEYKDKLNRFMKNTKLQFMLGEK